MGRIRLDPHIHTVYSLDGVNTPKEILEHVKRYTRLDAIAFTDHNRLFSRKSAEDLTRDFGILVVPGIELGRLGTGKHIVALNIDEIDVKRLLKSSDPHEVVEYVSASNGLSIAAHPVPRGYSNFSEICFDAVEMINGGCPANNRLIRNPCDVPEIGSSDAHLACHVGRAWTDVDIDAPGFNPAAGAHEIRAFTDRLADTIRKGCCRALGEPAENSLYLKYGLSVGKKYIRRSFNALRSMVL